MPPTSRNLQDLLERAVACHQAGNLAEAERCYRAILETSPDEFDVLHYLGMLRAQCGRREEALVLIRRALNLNPQSTEANANLGNVLVECKRPAEALEYFGKALALAPDNYVALYNRGSALRALKRNEEALASYAQALTIEPRYIPALANRGDLLNELKRHEEALECFQKALAINPGHPGLWVNLGISQRGFKLYEEALVSYDKALALQTDYAEALNNRGNALLDLNRPEAALESFDRALRIHPGYADALNNRGNALFDLKGPAEALASWNRALAVKPDFAEALNNRGPALQKLQRHAEAIASYEKVLEIDPDYEFLHGNWLHARMQICDWSGIEDHLAQLAAKIETNKKVSPPFPILGLSGSLSLQRKAAEIWVKYKYPSRLALPKHPGHSKNDKIKIGYFSADFRNHPVSLLTVGLFEAHDRSMFELTAFSFGPDPKDEVRRRIEAAFDNFIDVRNKSDKEVAMLARQQEIDIAVDLGGFTEGGRPGIFAMGAAPLQSNFLGYAGTMGAEYIDYIFADATIIPECHESQYSEKIVYIPSYQPNDSTRVISGRKFSREEFGLPQTGFVFCCFNNHYKITPHVFDSWMRILMQVEGSVLWLSAGSGTLNLKKEASLRGIAPERLIFAERRQLLEEHLARHRLADLFIDTLPYNAHTTASDALWAGVPVLTCLGTTFAGRVAASLLNAVGLPELVTHSLEDYEALALKLATDAQLLAGIKAKLARNRSTHPLFDTDRFRRHIEAAYITMWERYQRGEPPASFAVPTTT